MPHEEHHNLLESLWGQCLIACSYCWTCWCFCCPEHALRPSAVAGSDSYADLLEARGQRLLSGNGGQESAIEAISTSPPRLPPSERRPLLKGRGPCSSEEDEAAASAATAAGAAADTAAGATTAAAGEGGGGKGGSSPKKHRKMGSGLSLGLEDEELCPTCLEGYSEENPKVLTACGHAFHLQCIYEWLERSQTCPVCSRKMHFDELFE